MPRRKKIFLSYRRGDTAGHVGRLHDELVRVFGAHRVFMDVGGIAPGDDFVNVLRQGLAESVVVLVAMGPRWAGINDDGTRRIDDPNDFVHLEVATALADSRARVIPVLCEGAKMPTDSWLPAPLRALTRRQAFEVSDMRWRHDVDALFDAVKHSVPVAGRFKRAALRAAGALGLVALLAAGAVWTVRTLAERFADDAKTPGNRTAGVLPRDGSSGNQATRDRSRRGDTPMPSAPPPRVVPPNVISSVAGELARARREWVTDAVVTSIDLNCSSGRDGACPLRIRLYSASRVASLDASREAPDSAWTYRQNGGSSRTPALSLEIVELDRILAAMRAEGITSDLDRARLEQVQLQNGTTAPRWTIWPRDRQQAGREGRLCYEPQSGTRVDCRTGQ
ncbi:MAG: toll/interleukin-1 receptor domain-containing protein [Gemmatimonadaceae bacterium]|nr:toll/interleukin-1 receptor domain-containing protein [Gemmatimonadaceae bacterium]